MQDLIANFRVEDVVDVGVIAFLVYHTLDLIRGTRAARMLLGLGVVFLVFFTSQLFDLYTVNWVLDNFLSSILLVIIVVALPLYWMFEPSRQAGAQEGWDGRFASWGASLFAPTAEGGFNCAGCHGGMAAVGGEAPFTVTDPVTR